MAGANQVQCFVVSLCGGGGGLFSVHRAYRVAIAITSPYSPEPSSLAATEL